MRQLERFSRREARVSTPANCQLNRHGIQPRSEASTEKEANASLTINLQHSIVYLQRPRCSTWNNFGNQPIAGNVPRGTFLIPTQIGRGPKLTGRRKTASSPPCFLPKITEVFHRTAFFALSLPPPRSPP